MDPQLPADTNTNTPISESTSQSLREGTITWICTILCSLLVYIASAYIIKAIYNPDTNALKNVANELLIGASLARPEPMEALLFRAGVLISGGCLAGFYILFSKLKKARAFASKKSFHFLSLLSVFLIAALIYIDFAAQNPFVKDGGDIPQNARDMVGFSNFDFYFDGFFLGSYIWVYTFIITPLIACLFFFGIKKYRWERSRFFEVCTNVIGYSVLGGTIAACIAMNIFSYPYTFENKYDFNAVYYSMTQVNAGLPMFVRGFTNTYGLYPEFLNPIFRITGLSILNFATVLALILGSGFIMNFYALKRLVNNRVILFLGMFSVLFFPFLDFKLAQAFDCNFAFYPIRYIIPSLLIFLASRYFCTRSKQIYWATTITMAASVLWNPEFGTVSFLSWLAANTFTDFYDKAGKVSVKKMCFHWLAGIATLIVVFYTYKSVIYVIYGTSPDMGLLFTTMLVFGKIGFNLLPMTLIHPWNLMVLALISGFLFSIGKWYNKEITPRVSMVFLLSIISLGFFFYFQGRSHNWQFALSSGTCFMLVTILGDELWDKIRDKNVPALNALFVVFLFIISFSFFEILYNARRIEETVYQENDKTNDQKDRERVMSNIDFIKKNSSPKEKIYLMTGVQYEGIYFGATQCASAFNPGEMDMFFKSDLAILEKRIADSSYDIFFEPGEGLFNYQYIPGVVAAMASCYEIKAVNTSMILLKKRKTKTPAASFFGASSQTVFHRKYSSDPTGIKSRADDATGIPAIALNTEFSVEVLFEATGQIYEDAVVAGNMDDSTGFVIAKASKPANYFFGINGKGFELPAPMNQWVYCVMNVFADHIEVYQNGVLSGTMPLQAPMRQAHQPLAIGNLGFMRYYFGTIAEVGINRTALSKQNIDSTWNSIKQQSL